MSLCHYLLHQILTARPPNEWTSEHAKTDVLSACIQASASVRAGWISGASTMLGTGGAVAAGWLAYTAATRQTKLQIENARTAKLAYARSVHHMLEGALHTVTRVRLAVQLVEVDGKKAVRFDQAFAADLNNRLRAVKIYTPKLIVAYASFGDSIVRDLIIAQNMVDGLSHTIERKFPLPSDLPAFVSEHSDALDIVQGHLLSSIKLLKGVIEARST